ncbi:MAG: hypothetical protein ABIH46_05915, partial [Chloroflexota bacterium]
RLESPGSMGDARSALRCLKCGSNNLKRLFSAPHLMRATPQRHGTTCCGREERCEKPPCSTGDTCNRR